MKKFLAITALVLGLGVQAQQTKETKKDSGIELIPKAGINIANQSIKNVNRENPKRLSRQAWVLIYRRG
jgi:hypothetical protein